MWGKLCVYHDFRMVTGRENLRFLPDKPAGSLPITDDGKGIIEFDPITGFLILHDIFG